MESNTRNQKTKKWKFSMPHSYIVIGMIIVFAMILTYIIPAGEYDRITDPVTGRNIVSPDSFHFVEQSPVSIFQMFKAIMSGMVDAADIIFFVFFSYAFMSMLIHVGAFNAGIGALLNKIKGKEKFIIPVLMLAFGAMGASFGMYEEAYGFVPLVMSITIAMGYDGLVGAVIVFVGVATGFAAAVINPYTIAIAQGIAELPVFSGFGLRIIIWICFMTLVIWYTMRYADKVKKDPTKSAVYGISFPFLSELSHDELLEQEFTSIHKVSLTLFAFTLILLVYGTMKFGWYLEELAGLFIIMMFVIGLVNKQSLGQICDIFIESSKNILFGALIIGIARTVLIVLQNGQIIDTVAYYMSSALTHVPTVFTAQAMLVFQNLINFFIPSGSGQAATSMPIMTPLADILGINRQIAVLAFQFGDGFSNLFWPTQVAIECGIAGIPLAKWYKYFGPLFLCMFILQMIFIAIAVGINYGPY
ncbi:TIGR00366 family protein [Clostridiaceae bacterium 35-E11]